MTGEHERIRAISGLRYPGFGLRGVFRASTTWAFGFSVTILFIALWGRAVVVDTDALAESLAPLADSALVGGVVADWMTEELIDSGYSPEFADPAVDLALESSATAAAMDGFISDVVKAAASSEPSGSAVDVSSLLAPAVPEVTTSLQQMGLVTDESEVRSFVSGLDPMVIREPGSPALVGPESPAAARLGTAAVLAFLGIVSFGYATAAVSEDRVSAVRELFTRVAVGGLGFAILLLIGSWITDPRGGRSPVPETISLIASSKWVMPLWVGLAAGAIAGAIYTGRRWLRRGGGSRSEGVPPIPREGRDLSRSGSR